MCIHYIFMFLWCNLKCVDRFFRIHSAKWLKINGSKRFWILFPSGMYHNRWLSNAMHRSSSESVQTLIISIYSIHLRWSLIFDTYDGGCLPTLNTIIVNRHHQRLCNTNGTFKFDRNTISPCCRAFSGWSVHLTTPSALCLYPVRRTMDGGTCRPTVRRPLQRCCEVISSYKVEHFSGADRRVNTLGRPIGTCAFSRAPFAVGPYRPFLVVAWCDVSLLLIACAVLCVFCSAHVPFKIDTGRGGVSCRFGTASNNTVHMILKCVRRQRWITVLASDLWVKVFVHIDYGLRCRKVVLVLDARYFMRSKHRFTPPFSQMFRDLHPFGGNSIQVVHWMSYNIYEKNIVNVNVHKWTPNPLIHMSIYIPALLPLLYAHIVPAYYIV